MGYRDLFIAKAYEYYTNSVSQATVINWFNSQCNSHPHYTRGAIASDAKWCAAFVSYVAYNTYVYSTSRLLDNVIPYECGTNEMANLYKPGELNASPYVTRYHPVQEVLNSTYVPLPGDLFFLTSPQPHVGIVTNYYIEGTSKKINTIEGNLSNAINTNTRTIDYTFDSFLCNEIPQNTLRGHLDLASSTQISGWAYNGIDNDRLRVHVYAYKNIGGTFTQVAFQQVMANQHRSDLQFAGIGDGAHAFNTNLNLKQNYGAGQYRIHAYIITADQARYPANKDCIGSPTVINIS